MGLTFDAQLGVAQEQAALDALAAEAADGAVAIRSASLETKPAAKAGKAGGKGGSAKSGGKGHGKKGHGKKKGGHGDGGPARRLLASLQSLLPPFLSGRKLKQDLMLESGLTQVGGLWQWGPRGCAGVPVHAPCPLGPSSTYSLKPLCHTPPPTHPPTPLQDPLAQLVDPAGALPLDAALTSVGGELPMPSVDAREWRALLPGAAVRCRQRRRPARLRLAPAPQLVRSRSLACCPARRPPLRSAAAAAHRRAAAQLHQ